MEGHNVVSGALVIVIGVIAIAVALGIIHRRFPGAFRENARIFWLFF